MKHNKKRNTAFIYETLSRELAKAVVEKNNNRKTEVLSVLKEYFAKGTPLAEELKLYKVLLETRNIQQPLAERLLQETKFAYSRLNDSEIFDAQSKIISAINKKLGSHVWANFVPNFKSLASVNAIFNPKTSVKGKVLFEQSIVDIMSTEVPLAEVNKMESIDNLTYDSFINKFNEKYTGLIKEQKDLLNQYVTSFSDNGLELKIFLNRELQRLKEAINNKSLEADQAMMKSKLQEVLAYLEEFRKREFTDTDLNKVLMTQQLVQEISEQ